jgi:hypothetical protein
MRRIRDDDLEYKDATELPSLHIYHDNNNTRHQLYQRYGGGKVVPNKSKAPNLILKQPLKQLEKENEHDNENENENKMHVHASTSTAGRDGNAKAMDANELRASRNEIVKGNGVVNEKCKLKILFCAARDIQEEQEEDEKCSDVAGAGPCKVQ